MKLKKAIKRFVVGLLTASMTAAMLTGCSNGLSKDKNALTKGGGMSQEDA